MHHNRALFPLLFRRAARTDGVTSALVFLQAVRIAQAGLNQNRPLGIQSLEHLEVSFGGRQRAWRPQQFHPPLASVGLSARLGQWPTGVVMEVMHSRKLGFRLGRGAGRRRRR